MRDPSYAETSAASLSRYQTTKAGGTTFGATNITGKSVGVPTYPLQHLRGMDESQGGLPQFEEDEEKGISKRTLAPAGNDLGNVSTDREPQAYQGVYIQSQTL
jgi:hypothetical protein